MAFDQILQALNDGGIIALLLLIIIAGARQWWVWGWTYEAEKKEKEYWRDLALRGTRNAERAVDIAGRAIHAE